MSDDIRPTDQLIYAIDIYDASHCLLVDPSGNLKVTAVGGASETTVAAILADLNLTIGVWAYYAGTSGTVSVTSGHRVRGIAAHSTTGGTYTINGGATITIPANSAVNIEPGGNLTAPTIVFTGTDSYVIEVVH